MTTLRQSIALLNRTRIDFVQTEIDLGITLCKIARKRKGKNSERCLAGGRAAYQIATKNIFHLDMTHKQFNTIAANLERLKFELEWLENARNHH